MSLWISVRVAGIKLISLGGGAGGKRNGSGESDGKNLVRMRSILSLKKSRNVLARDDASGDSGSEFEGFRWRIVLRVFQSVRGLSDDSVTRLDKNEDLALEMRDRTELHWARNFMRSKGDFQRRQHQCAYCKVYIYLYTLCILYFILHIVLHIVFALCAYCKMSIVKKCG